MKTIAELAIKAGCDTYADCFEFVTESLERFAALIREDERERNGRGDYMEGLEEGYAAGQRDEREKQQEPVAWVSEGEVHAGFGGKVTRKFVVFDQTLPVGTKLYTTPPTAAQATRQMRDAAVQKLMEIGPSIGASRGVAMKFAAEIAALPIPGEEK